MNARIGLGLLLVVFDSRESFWLEANLFCKVRGFLGQASSQQLGIGSG